MIQLNILRSVFLAIALTFIMPIVGMNVGLFQVEAAQAQSVARINVDGNVRVDDTTVRSYLTIRVGDVATSGAIQSSIASLNGTGLFSNVSVRYSGGTLQVTLSENLIVASVLFEGNVRYSDEQLLAMVNLGSRGTFTEARLASDVQTIKYAYDDVGYTNVTVSSRTEVGANSRMRVVFIVNEGDRAGIAAINFTGNASINSGTLKSILNTKESHLLSWLLQDDSMTEEKLAADKEILRLYYANRGFPDARVLSAVAEFDFDRNAYFINFTIDEGDRYTFGSISVETSIGRMNSDALMGSIRTYSGDRYSFADIQRSVEDMAYVATGQGFAFAEVRPRLDRDVVNKVFNITYLVDEGARIYVERVNIIGNTRTRDFVIRRELDFAEGDPFNRAMVARGKSSIEQLDFFSQVLVSTERGSSRDKVVITIAVVEKPTGDYGASAGWSSTDGVLGEVSLTERNFLGRGQYLRLALGASTSGQTYDLSFTEPRFMGMKISTGIDIYKRISTETATSFYGSDATGGQLRFGVPITEELNVTFLVGAETRTFTDTVGGLEASEVVSDGLTLNKVFIGYTLGFNSLDSMTRPTEGLIASLSQRYVSLDHNYLQSEIKARYFISLIPDSGVVGSIRGQAGIINDFSGSGVHAAEAFRAGSKLVRGFEVMGIGPRGVLGEALGATMYAGISAEVEFPIPVLPESYGLRGAVWADAAIVSGVPAAVAATGGLDQLVRSSVGASIIWDSPFGPLRGDFAHVLQSDVADRQQVFQFSISTLL